MDDPNAGYQLGEELVQLTPAGYVNVCYVQMFAAVRVCAHVLCGLEFIQSSSIISDDFCT